MTIGSVVFAAGRGKRLRPLTDSIPKPALPVLDVPVIAWSLAELSRDAAPVVVNASHLHEPLLDVLSTLTLDGYEVVTEFPEPYGTAGTLRALRERVAEQVVTCNSDLITSLRTVDLVEAHRASGAPATVAVLLVEEQADLTLSKGRVDRFVDRRDANVSGARFLGVAVFDRSTLDLLPDERPAGLGETLLRTLAERGELAAYVFDGYWRDLGTFDEYLAASLDVLHGRAPPPPIPLPGEVIQVEGGLAYVGPGAQAAEDSLHAGAIVLSGATVEPGASVTNAIVWPGARVPTGSSARARVFY